MATVNVLVTTGTINEIIEKVPDVIHLFIQGFENCNTKESHEYGDLLFNEVSETRFALIAKEDIDSKIIPEALRLSILNLFKHLIEQKIKVTDIVISKLQFRNEKEEIIFTCILKELLMTYFGEIFTEPINLVICDAKSNLSAQDIYGV